MPVPEHRAAVDRHLLRDTAYEKVCAAIVDGTLAPGEPLHDEELCGWLGPQPHAGARRAEPAARGGARGDGAAALHARAGLTVRDVHEVVPAARRRARPGDRARGAAPERQPTSASCAGRTRPSSPRCATATGSPPTARTTRFHAIFVDRCGNPEVARVLAPPDAAPAPRRVPVRRRPARRPVGRPAPGDHHARRDRRRRRRGLRGAGELDVARRRARARLRARRARLAPRPAGESAGRDLRPPVDERHPGRT